MDSFFKRIPVKVFSNYLSKLPAITSKFIRFWIKSNPFKNVILHFPVILTLMALRVLRYFQILKRKNKWKAKKNDTIFKKKVLIVCANRCKIAITMRFFLWKMMWSPCINFSYSNKLLYNIILSLLIFGFRYVPIYFARTLHLDNSLGWWNKVKREKNVGEISTSLKLKDNMLR